MLMMWAEPETQTRIGDDDNPHPLTYQGLKALWAAHIFYKLVSAQYLLQAIIYVC